MDGIGCACYMDASYAPVVFDVKIIKARKVHICCECADEIVPGAKYEYVSGLWDGHWDHYKTCAYCARIRNDFFHRGCIFGELAESLAECYGVSLC